MNFKTVSGPVNISKKAMEVCKCLHVLVCGLGAPWCSNRNLYFCRNVGALFSLAKENYFALTTRHIGLAVGRSNSNRRKETSSVKGTIWSQQEHGRRTAMSLKDAKPLQVNNRLFWKQHPNRIPISWDTVFPKVLIVTHPPKYWVIINILQVHWVIVKLENYQQACSFIFEWARAPRHFVFGKRVPYMYEEIVNI